MVNGLCDICSNPGVLYTCSICGKRVCHRCYVSEKGVCILCLRGRFLK
ncbi:MAG: orotate phosphoribosyltransferase [Candidatus Altiarchaeales archaeon]|nr:MAG: orotate phosphoribosyltransferase [Candidatus Altiarchaeales archaeon]HDO81887.1 orotate phosphoribosyltransferase [Candidatus Altiarchaeales archaeon]HEX54536.1 orotate phosphoribosyltransferase [Candidatus Altiarchaeales archaeon]